MLAENPHLNQLILEQIVYARKNATRYLRRSLAVRFFAGLESLLADGVRSGEFRDVDPRFVHVALMGACEFFVSARGMLEELFDKRELTPELFDNYADFVSDLLVNGIGARR
jgi:superfamily II RNA helicase